MVSGLVWWSPLISFWWGASSTDWHWPLGGDEDENVVIDNIRNHKCVCGWGWWWEWILKIVWETQVSRQQKCKITFLVNCFFVELYLLVHDLSLPCFWSMFQKNRKKTWIERPIMALFSYNNYPHLWFPLGRPGGQGGNISLWAIASKHNEEQSKSIIVKSSDWSRQEDKFAKFSFAPLSFFSLPHLYLPLCQPSHLS